MNRREALLADDHRMLSDGLRSLLQPHFDVVGDRVGRAGACRRRRRLDPDVVVLEVSMPSLNGIDAARRLRRTSARAKAGLPDHAP